MACDNLGDRGRALGLYEQGLKLARELDDKQSEGICLANLGESYGALGDLEKAKELLEDSLRILEGINWPHTDMVRDGLMD